MDSETIIAVKHRWEKTAVPQQRVLVVQFTELHGPIHTIIDWYLFLAMKFNIKEADFSDLNHSYHYNY